MRDLLTQPMAHPKDLGLSLPPLSDAASVCLPTWQDVVDYEELHPRMEALFSLGYPRFVYHQDVLRLHDKLAEAYCDQKEEAVVLVNPKAAERLNLYLEQQTGRPGRIDHLIPHGPTLVSFRRRCSAAVKAYWQHTGEGISSRQARDLINDDYHQDDAALDQTLRNRLAGIAEIDPQDVLLYGNGMQGIFTIYRALQLICPGKKTVQFGFPYVDTLKIQQQFGHGCHFHPEITPNSYQLLQEQLAEGEVSAIFTEIPSNPLLKCVDLIRLRALCDQYDVLLVVDDSVTSTGNVDLRHVADLVTSSLTKFFSGVGNVVAGTSMLMQSSRHYQALSKAMTQEYHPSLYPADAEILEINCRDYQDRLSQINKTTLALVEALENHPAIDQLYYPTGQQQPFYDAVKRSDGGYGGVFSFTVKAPETNTAPVYDALEVSKGPSFGANFSMACPFTLLAHYHELERVESLGLSRWLIRVSIGLEAMETLLDRFQRALAKAQ